jgi:hypothetical protein
VRDGRRLVMGFCVPVCNETGYGKLSLDDKVVQISWVCDASHMVFPFCQLKSRCSLKNGMARNQASDF